MSFSNPRVKNPTVKFLEFKGESGTFQYYDKETEKNITLPLPIYFVVLDELHTVKGYNKNYKAGIVSNEVRNIKEELLSVRVFKTDIKLVGTWEKIKGEVERIQGHYSKSVYAGLIVKDKPMELVNFQFHGASRSPWFDYKGDKEKFGVSVLETVEDSSGSVSFKRPVFKAVKLRDIDIKQATELDRQLQEYLKHYFSQKEEEIVNSSIEDVQDVKYDDTKTDTETMYSDIDQRFEEKKNTKTTPDGADDLPF